MPPADSCEYYCSFGMTSLWPFLHGAVIVAANMVVLFYDYGCDTIINNKLNTNHMLYVCSE